jgi:glycosyltransferase involved in cell wall biosynthesis
MDKVLIDYTYYQEGTFHGGGEYGDTVLRRLLEIKDVSFGLVYYSNMPIHEDLKNKCEVSGWNIHAITSFNELPDILLSFGYNRFYSALPYKEEDLEDIRLPEQVEFIATYHGLRFLELTDWEGIVQGDLFGLKDMDTLSQMYKYYRDALNLTANRRIIAVSEHTKYSLIEFFPALASERIEVLYSPMKYSPDELPEDKPFLDSLGISAGNYALMISAGTWYKNALYPVVAYDNIFDSNYPFIPDDYKVVILGGANNENIQDAMRHRDRFVFPPFLPTESLELLYKNAHLFVFPSLNEGFGYPPIEAMKYGTVCACAADTSITEICRDMVLFFNPMFINEISNRLLQSFSEDIRETLKKRMQKLDQVFERQQKDLDRLIDIIAYGK